MKQRVKNVAEKLSSIHRCWSSWSQADSLFEIAISLEAFEQSPNAKVTSWGKENYWFEQAQPCCAKYPKPSYYEINRCSWATHRSSHNQQIIVAGACSVHITHEISKTWHILRNRLPNADPYGNCGHLPCKKPELYWIWRWGKVVVSAI